jgi:hypothetical protein
MDPKSPTYRAYVMFILVVVYTFNFIDRQIVGILAVTPAWVYPWRCSPIAGIAPGS